ncbi:MAG TPA: aspartate aminotransferase family protein [Myxococcota bacterium]|nr:aspartate aminotransferase family protein [Myxococcota bacterium]HRY95830.1 aspartate aminotransferase family protein [Myxococcota bacterium]
MSTQAPESALLRALRERWAEGPGLYRQHVNPGFAELLDLAGFGRRYVRAEGLELEDERGERYLDFTAGYGVHALGHNHPAVRAALHAMLDSGAPGFTQVEASTLTALGAEALAATLPAGLDKVFFCSSGSEAMEAALKLARAATGRRRILGIRRSFHGTTLGVLGLLDAPARRERFGPLLPGLELLQFGDRSVLARALGKRDVAALVVEPVQGEGGCRPQPEGYLAEAARLCREHGALLIVDEVQCGLGRTGRMWAFEHEPGLVPDALATAKALGGGLMPVGALVVRSEVHAQAYGAMRHALDHKTTFSGGPLAMAALHETLRVLRDEGLVENARARGAELSARLAALAARHPSTVSEVRGRGLLQGIRFHDATGGLLGRGLWGKLGDLTAGMFAQHVSLGLLADHHIVTQVGACDLPTLKLTPPLTVTAQAIERVADALDEVLSRGGHAQAVVALAGRLLGARQDRDP